MNRKQRIQTILTKELPEWSVELVDDSINHKGHFGLSGNSESHFIINLKDIGKKSISDISYFFSNFSIFFNFSFIK